VHADSLKRVLEMITEGSNCGILIAGKASPPPPDHIHISNSLVYTVCVHCLYVLPGFSLALNI